MSHMVIFRTPEGKPGYQPADTVNDAVAVVERLRNDEGVENVRIFRLEELTFEYRPYYKVELSGATDEGSPEPVAGLDEGGDVGDGGAGSDQASAEAAPEASVDGAIDVSNEEVDADDSADSFGEAPESHSAGQPPWAAPPPPPPGPPPESTPFAASGEDEEFSASARRGLFGR